MNLSIIIFLLYLALLGGVLFLARRSTESKRIVIKKLFNLEPNQIRSTGYNDPRIRKFTSIGWSLAFVMAGVLLIPTVTIGDNIWIQIIVILAMELGFLLVGLAMVRTAGIMNWYLECYICNFQFYRKGFGLTVLAIVLGNVTLVMPFIPLGIVVQLAAVGVMATALYFMVSPILKETKYYTKVGTGK